MGHPKTLVIQPRSGIGDMIWHLSHIRAIAREVEGGSVYLLTKSKAHAKKWLSNEPSIAVIDYLDRRNMLLTALRLRSYGFKSAWVLHQSMSYALVPFMAGIPQRIGPGYGSQKLFLTNEPLAPEVEKEFHINQMDALIKAQNLQLRVEDQRIILDPTDKQFIENRYSDQPRPLVTFGVGASEDFKAWPAEYFIQLAKEINNVQPSTFFICGSPAESPVVQLITNTLKQQGMNAIAADDLTLQQSFALLSKSNLFVGNDSSLLNASACVGVQSIGLFGATPVLNYSPFMHAVIPTTPGLTGKEGMVAISSEQVFALLQERQLVQEHIKSGTA